MPRARTGAGPGTHTLVFLLLTERDEIGLERGPNKDMSEVVCVQPKEHPRIEEAKRSQDARSWFSFVFRLKKEQTSAAVRVKVPVLVLLKYALQRCDTS